MLADASTGEQVAAELERRVRIARDLAHRAGVSREGDGGRGGFPLQPFVDDQPAVVRGAGNLIGVVGFEAEERGVRGVRLGDLVAAIRPFHEEHPAAGRQAVRHAVKRLGDRRHGSGDDPGDRAGELRADLVREDLDPLQLQPRDDPPEELGARPARLGQDHLHIRPRDLERHAGQSRPRAHVDQRSGEFRELQDEQAIDIMLEHHVFKVMDARQVQLGIRRAEHPVVRPELVVLGRRQREPAALDNRLQGGPAGSHAGALHLRRGSVPVKGLRRNILFDRGVLCRVGIAHRSPEARRGPALVAKVIS